MSMRNRFYLYLRSLPAWECGLKYHEAACPYVIHGVTPCVGVWIEITGSSSSRSCRGVTPCVGVWIEIPFPAELKTEELSHSLRGSVD